MNLLTILKKNKGKYLSGQEISRSLSISRTAVWKKIKNLENMGYIIDAVKNKGYMLVKEPDILFYDEISPYLDTELIGRSYVHFDQIESTNTYAKENISKLKDGAVITAEKQTLGRGRLGRRWTVEKSDGILMSIVLKPKIKPARALMLTHIASLAVAEAIEYTGVKALIKWPNDIIVNNKKVCGILLEMIAELDMISAVIIGIGLNANSGAFPPDLSDKATSLKIASGGTIDRKKLTALILNHLEDNYTQFLDGKFTMDSIKSYSLTLGKNIRIIDYKNTSAPQRYIDCYAVDIDDDGYLVVRFCDGSIHTVMSGDVSVRGSCGYV